MEILVKRIWLAALILLLFLLPSQAKDFKNVVIRTAEVGNVPFPHEPHLKKLGSNCTLCHNALFAIGVKAPPVTMAEMEKGKSCGLCHNKVKAFGLSECARCHMTKEVPITVPDFGKVVFSHKFHLGLFSCTDCHQKLFKAGSNPHVTMAQMESGLSCGGCHVG